MKINLPKAFIFGAIVGAVLIPLAMYIIPTLCTAIIPPNTPETYDTCFNMFGWTILTVLPGVIISSPLMVVLTMMTGLPQGVILTITTIISMIGNALFWGFLFLLVKTTIDAINRGQKKPNKKSAR